MNDLIEYHPIYGNFTLSCQVRASGLKRKQILSIILFHKFLRDPSFNPHIAHIIMENSVICQLVVILESVIL